MNVGNNERGFVEQGLARFLEQFALCASGMHKLVCALRTGFHNAIKRTGPAKSINCELRTLPSHETWHSRDRSSLHLKLRHHRPPILTDRLLNAHRREHGRNGDEHGLLRKVAPRAAAPPEPEHTCGARVAYSRVQLELACARGGAEEALGAESVGLGVVGGVAQDGPGVGHDERALRDEEAVIMVVFGRLVRDVCRLVRKSRQNEDGVASPTGTTGIQRMTSSMIALIYGRLARSATVGSRSTPMTWSS